MRLNVVHYTIKTDSVNESIKIALLTDLHGCYYGENQKTLVQAIDDNSPDVILLGGDIFDDSVPYKHSEILLSQIADRYPCYYVTGNHEYWSYEVDVILDIISSYGVTIIDGKSELLTIGDDTIQISGISDSDNVHYLPNQLTYIQQLDMLENNLSTDYFSILLAHRPELIDDYLNYSYDLTLSGHAHGGQWRIPFLINGLYSPNQGLFPEYAGGLYSFENMDFIVSRGLARESTIVPRIFNRPELIFIDIQNAQTT